MPTDNPKISLYVPQKIYDRFREFQQEQNLSMSQAGTVVLAEYFGLEETIKETTEGTTIGGVTLTDFEDLKSRVFSLEKLVDSIKSTSKLLQNSKPTKKSIYQTELIDTSDKDTILIDRNLLAKRIGCAERSISNKMGQLRKKDINTFDSNFCDWTKQKDIDQIGWKVIKLGKKNIRFSPARELLSELHSKLVNWIKENK